MTLSFPAFCQLSNPQPKFKNFTLEDGLPGSETYYVHQDKKGYIWICTDHGVARYDGNKFVVFTTANGLTDNVVFSIYEDFKGRVWFLTYNSKLCYFENNKIHAYKYNHIINRESHVKIVPKKNIYIDRNENVYIGTEYNGELIIDKNGRFKKSRMTPALFISKKEKNQLFWYFFQDYYIRKSAEYIDIFLVKGKEKIKFAKYEVHGRIALSSSGTNDYLLNNQTLISLNSRKEICKEPEAISLYTNRNDVWIGTFKNGVNHIPDIKKPSQSYRYLADYSISSILCDAEGGYWFTTLEQGVFYTPSLAILNYSSQEGLMDNEVNSVAGIKDNIYVSFPLGRWQNLKYPEFNNENKTNKLRSTLGATSKKIYVSFIHTHELKDGKISPEAGSWSSDFYHYQDKMIFGIQSVFSKSDYAQKQDTLYNHTKDISQEKKNTIHTVMVDQNNILWVGSLSGLNYIQNNYTHSEGLDNPLFKVRVSDLECSPGWKNVVSTRGEGIYFFENKKIFRQLTTQDGLLSNQINVMYIDEHDGIWTGSNKGLNHIVKSANGKISIESFTTLHGLCSNEIYSIYVYDGLVYAATKRGLAVINTKAFKRNTAKTNIEVTSISTATQQYDPAKYHVFGYRENYIKIYFRNTNYRSLQKGLYRYRLNKSGKWIYTEIPEISFITPLPGQYDIEISYKNEDGNWSPSELACTFVIDNVFYKKGYFYIIAALLLGLIIWIAFRYRIKQLKRRHSLNNKIYQLEQRALQAQMNPHFIFNALNSIQSFLVYEENEKAEKYLLKFAQLIRQTLNNSRETYVSIETEIDTLTKYLDLERMRFKNNFTYKISNLLPKSMLNIKVPSMLIQPFAENAVIHGFSTLVKGGEINITLKEMDHNQILCIVEDNGIGRKKALQQSSKTHVSFGTTITEERLKAFETKHGINFKVETIDIENPDGTTGTRVLINLPIIKTE